MMSDVMIRMSDVVRRKFLLEDTKPSMINSSTLRHLKKNLTYDRLFHFLREMSNSSKDCDRYINEALDMINELEVPDIQKQPLNVQITDNILTKVTPDTVRNLVNKKARNGIPLSDTINRKVNDTIIMDRILKNNETLSKRFDFDKIIKTDRYV